MGFLLLGLGFYPISCCAKLISLIRSYLLYSVDVNILHTLQVIHYPHMSYIFHIG